MRVHHQNQQLSAFSHTQFALPRGLEVDRGLHFAVPGASVILLFPCAAHFTLGMLLIPLDWRRFEKIIYFVLVEMTNFHIKYISKYQLAQCIKREARKKKNHSCRSISLHNQAFLCVPD